MLIVVPVAAREQTERRLRAVSRAGKLAGWLGEHGADDPHERREGRLSQVTLAFLVRCRTALSARRRRPR
jgi:cell volume regulation protein A